VLRNFATTPASRFGVSLAVGLVIDGRTQTAAIDSAGHARFVIDSTYVGGKLNFDTVPAARQVGNRWAPNIYLLGHWRFLPRRPQPLHYDFMPIQSMSLFLGTNLVRGSLLDEIVGGFSIDRLLGSDVDIVLGVDRLSSKLVDASTWHVTQDWRYRFFFGAGFEL
jgi:hypothetical protein